MVEKKKQSFSGITWIIWVLISHLCLWGLFLLGQFGFLHWCSHLCVFYLLLADLPTDFIELIFLSLTDLELIGDALDEIELQELLNVDVYEV